MLFNCFLFLLFEGQNKRLFTHPRYNFHSANHGFAEFFIFTGS